MNDNFVELIIGNDGKFTWRRYKDGQLTITGNEESFDTLPWCEKAAKNYNRDVAAEDFINCT